jgi:branched-chain amino acid transport system ATP-binding protein
MTESLLTIDKFQAGYDSMPVTRDIRLSVGHGEVVSLLGPNGAGKTTTLATVSGFLPLLGGSIRFDGQDIAGRPPHRIVQAGLVQVPEGRGLVPSLTVNENFRLVRQSKLDPYGVFPALVPLGNRRAGLLSGGEQQMLALARAIMLGPKLLLVDELSLGLAPKAVDTILKRLRGLATETGMSVLLVEQHVSKALAVSDRAYVLSHGRITLQGAASKLLSDRQLLESSYMGEHAGGPAGNADAPVN